MRVLAALVFGCLLLAAAEARAGALGVPALSVDPELALTPPQPVATGGGDVMQAKRTYLVPQRYAFALDESRAFWFAAGASAAASLGVHVLIGIPVGLFGAFGVAAAAAANPAVGVPLLVAMAGTYLIVHAVGAGLLSGLVFNSTSELYDANLFAGIAAHAAGDVLAAGVTATIFGAGALVWTGVVGLTVFTGSAGLETILVLTILGALPAVVVAGAALVIVPALLGSWALAVTATPAEGYATAPDWRRPLSELGPDDPALQSSRAAAPADARTLTVATFQLGP